MKPRLKSTRAARDLIKAHEPFHGEAVRRGKRWVVGYGHTAAAKPGQTLSRDDADLLLVYDVLQAETAVHAALGEDLPGPVRDALVSFAASVGLNAFKVSDVARLAKAGKREAAAAALETWVRAEEDGRLVTSDRLVKRRAAEKALMLASETPQAPVAPEPEPEPAPAETPEAPAAPEAPEAPEADAAPANPGPGPLVDVDIAFEDFEDPEDEIVAPIEAPVDAPVQAPAEPARAEAAEPAEFDASAAEAPAATTGADDAPAAAEPEPLEDERVEAEEAASHDADGAIKASQDAAIRAVMSRMAGDISRSVSVAGVGRPDETPAPQADAETPDEASAEPGDAHPAAVEPEGETPAESRATAPDQDLSGVQLGYAFLQPDVVGWAFIDDEPAADTARPAQDQSPEPDPEPQAEPVEAPAAEPAGADYDDETTGEIAGEAAGPGRTVASPAPGPVYASVSVGPIATPETAPPHPAEAPAAAPGLSGESEGPDHPEDADMEDAAEDEAELDPALVAGPEAEYVVDETPPGAVEGRGDWVHGANLVAGTALTGLGAWQIGSNLDAYLAAGLGYNWIGPGAFAGGVLLLVSSGWVVVGKMMSKKG